MHQTDPVYKIQEVDFVAATKNNNSMDLYSGYSGSGGKKHKMMNIKKKSVFIKYSTFFKLGLLTFVLTSCHSPCFCQYFEKMEFTVWARWDKVNPCNADWTNMALVVFLFKHIY